VKIWHARNQSQQGKQHFWGRDIGIINNEIHLLNLADATPLAKAVHCHDNPKQPCLAGRL